MNGLKLAKKYYNETAAALLQAEFADLFPCLAVGLCGSGSECFGYDDSLSTDHDFEPGFIIFIPGEDVISRSDAFRLEKFYNSLPNEFSGFTRQKILPGGGSRHGIIRTGDFFLSKTGRPDGNLSPADWLSVPENYFLEATNGEIFLDNYGELTMTRAKLSYFPEDIRIKKIVGNLIIMYQSGAENLERAIKRGDNGGAALSAYNFTQSAMHTSFLLNKRYMPYYKWAFRAFSELPIKTVDAEQLISILNDSELRSLLVPSVFRSLSLSVCEAFSLSHGLAESPERLALSLNDLITDNNLRNAGLLAGV